MSARPAERPGYPAPTGVRVPLPSAWWVLIGGVIGLFASITLTVEKIRMLLNPSYVPSCNLNPVLSCGSVMATPQASVFGFPNSLIGIAAFTVVVVSGVLAVTNVPIPQWYWTALAAAITVADVFMHWLIFQSVYRIGALCPYCMVVWAVTIPLQVVLASIAFRPARENGESAVAQALHYWRWPITALWFTAVILLIVARFWDYWSTLL